MVKVKELSSEVGECIDQKLSGHVIVVSSGQFSLYSMLFKFSEFYSPSHMTDLVIFLSASGNL